MHRSSEGRGYGYVGVDHRVMQLLQPLHIGDILWNHLNADVCNTLAVSIGFLCCVYGVIVRQIRNFRRYKDCHNISFSF